jgi:hypothetical protein
MLWQTLKHFLGLAPDPCYRKPQAEVERIAGQELHLQIGTPETRAYRHISRMVNIAKYFEKASMSPDELTPYLDTFKKEKKHLEILGITVPDTLLELKKLKGSLLFEAEKNG